MALPYVEQPGRHVADITLYALSTCPYCRATKEYLNQHGIEYKYIDIDTLPLEEAEEAEQVVEEYNPHDTFPTLVVNGGHQVIVGYQPNALEELISRSHFKRS